MNGDERNRLEAMRAPEISSQLQLALDAHGGWSRKNGETTLYLLGIGDCLDWHRIVGDDEEWAHVAGGPLALSLSPDGHDASAHILGRGIAGGDMTHATVLDGHWRTAEPLGEWVLMERRTREGVNREDAPAGWRPVPREPAHS